MLPNPSNEEITRVLNENANTWQCEIWHQDTTQIINFSDAFLLPATGIEVALLTNQLRYGREGVGTYFPLIWNFYSIYRRREFVSLPQV